MSDVSLVACYVGRSVGRSPYCIKSLQSLFMSIQSVILSIQSLIESIQSVIESIQLVIKLLRDRLRQPPHVTGVVYMALFFICQVFPMYGKLALLHFELFKISGFENSIPLCLRTAKRDVKTCVWRGFQIFLSFSCNFYFFILSGIFLKLGAFKLRHPFVRLCIHPSHTHNSKSLT